MTYLDRLLGEPWAFDFFATMRRLERSFPDRPRIGDSEAMRDDYVRLGEDPYLDFPASTIAAARRDESGEIRLFVKFLGFLGPQGALPLASTEEAYLWVLARDDAFPRFLDLFNNRFLQLFFRAWADSRPIAHHDRPQDDRFADYVGSMIGIGTKRYLDLDSIADMGKLGFAGLIAPQTKSASRLAGFLSGLFRVRADVEQFVGSWLELDPDERTMLGERHAGLGVDMLLGRSVYSVQDKIKIRIYVRDLAQYRRFLPVGDLCKPLADAVFFYCGAQLDWEVELAIPVGAVEPMRLGRSGELGWTGWMSPNWSDRDQTIRADARFNPAARFNTETPAASRHGSHA